jgi:hypothetical protein
MKKCPILMFVITLRGFGATECLEKDCAWWNGNHCAILVVSGFGEYTPDACSKCTNEKTCSDAHSVGCCSSYSETEVKP